jgi:peptide subunit release factor 1 (eRF1)
VGGSAYLLPLAVGHGEQALVAVVSRERGEIFSLEQGRLRTRADLSEEQPRRHRDAEAWQQSKLERRVDTLAHKHLVRIARELDREVHSTPGVRVVLAGEVEHTAAVAHLLSAQGRAALAGAARAEAHAGAAELMPLVMPLLERSSRERERELVTRWRSALDATGLGVQGWPAVLAAASAGRVELLLLANEVSETPGECPVCGRGGREHTRCPVDGATFEPRSDSLDLAVQFVLSHGGEVRRVAQDTRFDALGGVGAILRFRG